MMNAGDSLHEIRLQQRSVVDWDHVEVRAARMNPKNSNDSTDQQVPSRGNVQFLAFKNTGTTTESISSCSSRNSATFRIS